MNRTITFIGGGNMAGALIGGLVSRGTPKESLNVVDPAPAQRTALAGLHGVGTSATVDATTLGEVVVLAVKPQQLHEAASQLRPHVSRRLVISVAAGVRATDLSRWLDGHARIIRAMPNTPALIGEGVAGLAALPGISADDRAIADSILAAVGGTVWFDDESALDAVTAVSGSGPAYVFLFMEAIEQAAHQLGLTPAQARQLTLATFRGAAALAAGSPEPPSVLRERVTSKGGTTAAALAVMQSRGLAGTIVDALRAAHQRSQEMGREFGN